MPTLDEIKNMTDAELAAANKVAVRNFLAFIALKGALTLTVILAAKRIAKMLDNVDKV